MDDAFACYEMVGAMPVPGGGVLTDVNALGEAWPSRVGTVDVDVLLPSISERESETGAARLGPPLNLPEHHVRWGSGDEDEGALCVAALAIGIRSGGSIQASGDMLAHNIDSWLELVTDWLAVWSGQPVHQRLPSEALKISGEQLELWATVEDATQFARIEGRGPVSLMPLPGEPVSYGQWKRATEFATNGTPPPLQYLLLRQAHQELFREESRRSVVEAGTAAELALSEALHAELCAIGGQQLAEAVLASVRGIGALSELAWRAGLCMSSPDEIRSKLAGPRNRAAHKAEDPSHEVAQQAVDVAEDVVQGLITLPA